MKKLLFTLLGFSLLFSSCSEDDKNGLTLNIRSVKLKIGEQYQIVAESEFRPLTFTAQAQYVATVSAKGKVRGERVGETDIVVSNGARSYNFTVQVEGNINLYPDPFLAFDMPKSTIIAQVGKPDEETTNTIKYNNYSDIAESAIYTFENDKLIEVRVLLNETSQLDGFMRERYVYLRATVFMNNFNWATSTVSVKTETTEIIGQVSIAYRPIREGDEEI